MKGRKKWNPRGECSFAFLCSFEIGYDNIKIRDYALKGRANNVGNVRFTIKISTEWRSA